MIVYLSDYILFSYLNRLHAVDANLRHMASPRHILAIYSGDSLWRKPEAGGWVGGGRGEGGRDRNGGRSGAAARKGSVMR